MSLITVLEPPITNNAAFAGKNGKGSHLSWRSDLVGLSNRYSINQGGDVIDSDIDFVNDYMSTTTYFAKSLGELDLYFFGGNSFEINHVAMSGVNFEKGDVIGIDVIIKIDGVDQVVKSFDTSSRVSFYDNKVFVLLLDAIYLVNNVRVRFRIGEAQLEAVEVATLHASRTLEFPSRPAVGFKKGSWNTSDAPRTSRRQNNEFGASTVKRQGTEETATIPVVPLEFMDTEWAYFIRSFDYVPSFFSWNLDDFPLDTIYGNISFNDAVYKSSIYSELSFSVKGVI